MNRRISFEFNNQISPRYLQPLFLKLEPGLWYTIEDLRKVLRQDLPTLDGKKIVDQNVKAWNTTGLIETKVENNLRSKCFKLTNFGRFIQDAYSTNQDLFFDLIHYLFYSSWHRTQDVRLGRFWIYSQICDFLWDSAPSEVDSSQMVGIIQSNAENMFPEYQPKFPSQSIRAVFPWLTVLTPSFLGKQGKKTNLFSKRRLYCTPQLFHLAVDLIFYIKGFRYGTSMSIGDLEIVDICRVCLIDETKFWEMADRTKMFVRGFGVKQSQYGTSISLDVPPNWVELPDLNAHLAKMSDEDEREDE